MRVVLCWLVFVVCLTGLRQAHAEELKLVQEPVAIPVGQAKEFNFKTVPQAGTTVLLKIRSRINSQKLAGSWMVMRLEVNGREVQAYRSRTAMRLVNKPLESPVTPTYSRTWYLTNQGWRALYAPDFQSALNEKYYVDDPYLLVLDITDLTNPVAENRIKISNTADAEITTHSNRDASLYIGSLEVETKPVPSPMMAGSNTQPILNRGGPPVGISSYRTSILPGGGLVVKVGDNTYQFSSAFSYPNAGFNHLSAAAAEQGNQANWQIKIDPKARRVVAQGKDYRVVRTISSGKPHIEVSDTITNLNTKAPLGMSVRHEMNLSGLNNPQVRLAGDLMQNEYHAPANPSVHVVVPTGAVGMLAEDNVLRNQVRLYTQEEKEKSVAGLRTDMLRLAPGETYTMRWAIYPVAGRDYYSFINLVRNDWKANFTLPGGVWWLSTPDSVLQRPVSAIRENLQINNIRYVMVTGSWVDHTRNSKEIAYGTAVFEAPYEDYRRRIREATQKLREAMPDIKVLGYYDVQRDTSQNSAQRFADSWLTDEAGKQLSTDWSGQHHEIFSMVPTLENSFGKSALETARRYLDEMQFDGLYWDEMEGTGFNAPQLTYNMSDGQTCVLDPKTWTIQREVGLTTLLSQPFRLKVIDEVHQRGKTVFGNGGTKSSDDLKTGILRMVEIQHNDEIARMGDLQTPFGYVDARVKWEDYLRAFGLAKIPTGYIPGIDKTWKVQHPHDITPYLFPFTPVELYSGYLLGRERIIATHSGNYGWHGEKALSLTRHFDENGKLTQKRFSHTINARESRAAVKLGTNEAIVLEKLPLRFEPKTVPAHISKNTMVTVFQADEKGVELKLDTPTGGTLIVWNSKVLPLTVGQQFSVQLITAGKTMTHKARVEKAALRVDVSQGFQGDCVVVPLK